MDKRQHSAHDVHNHGDSQAAAMHTATAFGLDSLSPGGGAYFCGAPTASTNNLAPFEAAATDRYGNAYSWAQIQIQDSVDIRGRRMPVSNDCGCDEFPNINTGFFEVDFEDCIMMTGVGFNDQADGQDRREAVCAALEYLSILIVPNDSECNPGQARKVNIRVLRSDSDDVDTTAIPEALPNNVLGYASPYYPQYSSYVGILHPVPWIIINSGEYPDGFDAGTYHADMRYNFTSTIIDWHYDYDAPVGPGLYDLYTTVLHEMTHALGFVSAFNNTEGLLGSRSGLGTYYAFDQFLQLAYAGGNTEDLIENGTPANGNSMSPQWFFNGMVDGASDLHSSCPGPGPDMTFDGGLGGHTIYTGTSFEQGGSFSHLDGACNAPSGSIIPYLMHPELDTSERRSFLVEELDILGRIGYTINCSVDTTLSDCPSIGTACNTASVGDNDPEKACDASGLVLSYQICPEDSSSSVISIAVDSLEALLMHNDPNAQNLAFIEPLFGDNLGTWELSGNGQEYLFTPDNILFFYDFHYAVESCGGAVGNTVRFTISVGPSSDCGLPVCEEDQSCASLDSVIQSWPHCGFRTVGEEQVNADCNIICNGGFGGTWAYAGDTLLTDGGYVLLFAQKGFGVIFSSPNSEIFFDSTYVLLPGWIRGNGSPDMWPNEQGDNHVLHLSGRNNVNDDFMEGIITLAPTAANQNYLAAFWAEEPFKSPPFPTPQTDNFRTPFISFISLSAFTPGGLGGPSSDPMYSGPEQRVFNTELITGDSIVRRGALVCADDNYDGVWVSSSNQFPYSGALVDNVEIIPDEFTAGSDIFSPLCNQQFMLGGQQFCMLSDVGVEYEWFRVDDDGAGGELLTSLGTYRVLNGTVVETTGSVNSALQVPAAPAVTTTYRLARTIYDHGGLPASFNFCKELPDGTTQCLLSDDVVIQVQEGLDDASFTWEETGCGTGVFDLSSASTDPNAIHAWFLDDNPTAFSSSANPVLGPLPNGQYTVRHEVSNICGTATVEETIVVDIPPVPEPVLSVVSITNCYQVIFATANLNPGDVIIRYDYGDGTGNGNGARIYDEPGGVYTVIVTVANSCGVEATDELTIDIGPAPDPGANLSITPTGECGVYTLATDQVYEGFDYNWDFGDGATSTEITPTHDFGGQGGNFLVTLTLEEECGGLYTYTQNLEVPVCDIDITDFDCDDCTTATNLGQAGVETFLSNVLPPGGYSHQIYCVEGDLLIQQNEDYNFVNCTFRMKPGASIRIATGGQMVASESVFHGCGQMWRGIEVEEGGELRRFQRNSVMDAQYAVYVHPSTGTVPPTLVYLHSNQFIANFLGVYYAESSGGVVNAYISGNDFTVYTSTDALKPPYPGQKALPEGLPEHNGYPLAGMYINRHASVFSSSDNSFNRIASGIVFLGTTATVEGNGFFDMDAHAGAYASYAYAGHALNAQGNGAGMLSAIDNEVKNCSHGIVSNRLSLEARGNMIDSVSFGIQAELPNFGSVEIGESGAAISNSIDAARIGVQVRAFDENATVNIQRNNISTYGAGATAAVEMGVNLASTTVEDNLITVAQAGSGISTLWVNNSSFLDNTITLSDPASAEAGMHFVFTRNCRVQGNTVNGAGTGGSQNYGMHIDFSPGNAYCNNTFDNTRFGTLVIGLSDAENNFKCNDFQEHEVGLQLKQSFFGLSRIGTQEHQSNCWSASSGGAVWNGVDFLTAQTYPFEVDTTVMSCFMPPSVMPAQGWFEQNSAQGQFISCGTNTCDPDEFNHESDDAHKIAQGQVGGDDYAASVAWMLQQYLYKRGYGLPTDSLTIQAFFNTHAHSSLGQFYNVDQQLKQLFESTPTEVADMDGFLQQLKGGLALLRTLDQALLLAAESEWDSLLDNRHQTANELLPVTDSITSAHSQIVHSRTNGMSALLTQNAGITAQAVFEINERFFNDALFRYLERGSTHLTSTELQRLQAIATQCPLSGGWPVFKARALLYVVTGQQANYENACAPQQALRQARGTIGKQSSQIQLYPNPARREVIVQLGVPLENTGHLQLFDTYGRMLLQQRIPAGVRLHRLALNNLESGLYIIRLNTEGEETTLKLIINH